MPDREGGDVPIKFADAVAPVLVPLRNLPHRRLQLVLQDLDVGLDAAAVFLPQALEGFGRDDLSVLHRGERQTHRRSYQRDTFLLRLLRQLLEGVLLLFLELLVERLTASAIVLAVEGRGNGRLELLDEVRHVLPELAPRPGESSTASGFCASSKLFRTTQSGGTSSSRAARSRYSRTVV